MNAWVALVVAGVFEIVWAVGLKYSQGFSKPLPATITVVAMGVSIYFLALALKDIPLGTGYAIWTGIGAAGTAVLGIILFAESAQLIRLFFIGLIIAGIVGLKYSAS